MKTTSNLDRIILAIGYVFIIIFALFCLAPFFLVIISSFTDELTIMRNGFSFFPKKLSLEAYKTIFGSDMLFNAYLVTIFITVVGTALSLIVTSGLSYTIAVDSVKYRNHMAFYVYFTMLFNGGLVPTYILITKYLHMKDSIWVLIIPSLVSPWNMFLLRNFFKTIPNSLAESAKIDGANDIYILFKIVLPVSLPALATIGLFYALGYWNEWFKAMLYISNEKLFPLQYIIMRIMRNATEIANNSTYVKSNVVTAGNAVKMATSVVTIGPIILLYPFLQKYFVKGLMVGSIKG